MLFSTLSLPPQEKSDSKDYKLEKITVNLDLADNVTFPNLNTSILGSTLHPSLTCSYLHYVASFITFNH